MMNRTHTHCRASRRAGWLAALLLLAASSGCGWLGHRGPPYDRPFPLGQVTDSFWESQQTGAEAADFIFYDHEFSGDTANLSPAATKKLMQVALRLEHVPFAVVVEQSVHNARPELDQQRRRAVTEQLARLGVENAEGRVVISPAFAPGFTAIEGEQAYYNVIHENFSQGGGIGRRFGGQGAFFR